MKTREQMQDEIRAMYQRVSALARDMPDADREVFGGTMAGLLMALRVVALDEPVNATEAMAAVRRGVAAVREARKASAS
jgi:hypothetical protein